MEKNQELHNAWDFIEHTSISMFLTGKAGTGKTTFLRTIIEKTTKRCIVVAPTGVAAINARGMTIHSFFQLPLSPFVPDASIKNRFAYSKEKRKIMRTLDLLIIDEISMVRADVLDAIDSVLRRFRDSSKPFGGVQLLMIGDLQQLTPVVTPEEELLLGKYYETPYFFGSRALKNSRYVTIELSHVYRQQDSKFISILNHIREGAITEEDLNLLNQRYNPQFQPQANDDYIHLTTHNRMADEYNNQQIDAIKTSGLTYKAAVDGNFPEYSYPAEYQLTLKVGTQVMFIRNDNSGLYYNGKIGHVTALHEDNVTVQCIGDEQEVVVEPAKWENTKYTLNENTKQIEAEVQGTYQQLPLRLAWAITIHKSQGLTFEHAIIDAESAFASGQVYVALSRCKSMEGLVLASRIRKEAIINDGRVSAYINNQAEEARKSIENLPSLKEEYYRELLIELFNFNDLQKSEEALFRVLVEYFYKYPKITALHKMAIADLMERVIAVSNKWEKVVRSRTPEELREPEFIERIKKGTLYFHSQLTEVFNHLIRQTADLKSNNKEGTKRYTTTFSDLKQSYSAKHELLEIIMENGFSVKSYLMAKQEAILDSLSDGTARKRKKKEATSAKKIEKKPTKQISFEMFKEGKTLEEIAKQRGLVVGTIMGHLIDYIKSGDIDINKVIEKQKVQQIQKAIKEVGSENGLKNIKDKCASNINYNEILLVLKSMQT